LLIITERSSPGQLLPSPEPVMAVEQTNDTMMADPNESPCSRLGRTTLPAPLRQRRITKGICL